MGNIKLVVCSMKLKRVCAFRRRLSYKLFSPILKPRKKLNEATAFIASLSLLNTLRFWILPPIPFSLPITQLPFPAHIVSLFGILSRLSGSGSISRSNLRPFLTKYLLPKVCT